MPDRPYPSDAEASDLLDEHLRDNVEELRLRSAIVTAAYEQLAAREHHTPFAYQRACKQLEDAVVALRDFGEARAARRRLRTIGDVSNVPLLSFSKVPTCTIAERAAMRDPTWPDGHTPSIPPRQGIDTPSIPLPTPVPPPFAGRCLVAGCPDNAPAGRAYCDTHTNSAAEAALPRRRADGRP